MVTCGQEPARRADQRRCWPGQDVPRTGAGPRPAGSQRRLRQAGGAAAGRRRPRPLSGARAAITSRRPPDPLSTAELEQQLAERGLHAALEKIIAVLEPVHDRSDVVVVEALTPGPARLYAVEINQGARPGTRRRRPPARKLACTGHKKRRGPHPSPVGGRARPDRGRRRGPRRDTLYRREWVLVW